MSDTVKIRYVGTPAQIANWAEMDRCNVSCDCESVCVVRASVRAEREACAKIAEEYGGYQGEGDAIARAIRNRANGV